MDDKILDACAAVCPGPTRSGARKIAEAVLRTLLEHTESIRTKDELRRILGEDAAT